MKSFSLWCMLLVCLFGCGNPGKKQDKPGKRTVEIIQHGEGFRLYRHGQPYQIKGVCVLNADYFRQAKESGANSVRTYSADNAGAILDAAQKQGLTVTLGLKLPYASMEMDYSDEKAVSREVEKVRKVVMQYKDHPALLMWGIGNELNLFLKSTSVPAYISLLRAIERIAKVIHETDPNHPTTTTVPYVRKNTITAMNMFCGNLDVISINSFEELQDMPKEAKKYSKPYIISEYGANGYWLSAQTNWNTHIEQTSQEKCDFIIQQSKAIGSDTGKCLGSYVFVWGTKLEYTESWFSMFTGNGEATQVIDALQYTWTGKWPENRAATIQSIRINNKKSIDNIYVPPGKVFTASITTGPGDLAGVYVTARLQKDDLEVSELYTKAHFKQDTSYNYLSDSLCKMVVSYDTVTEGGKAANRISIQYRAPEAKGPYRLFLNLHSRRNRIASANACFYVHE